MNKGLKVLFVCSGARHGKPSPIVLAQGNSIIPALSSLSYFVIKKEGPIGYLMEMFRLRKFLKIGTFDIIHAHYGLSGFVALLARRNHKLLVSFMGTDILGAEKDNGSLTWSSLLLAKLNGFLARYFYDYCIVKSQQMFSILNTRRKTLIPNGVDLDVFKPVRKDEARKLLGLDQEEKIAIFVSDPSRPEKNFHLAKTAVQLSNIPNLGLLTVYGLPHNQLSAYYNAANVLLLSSFHEGSPNVVKEAMACNCPIVSTDVGDVKQLIEGVNGCFISSFQPEDFAEKLEMAIQFSEINKQTKGRSRIVELKLDSGSVKECIAQVYQKVMAE